MVAGAEIGYTGSFIINGVPYKILFFKCLNLPTTPSLLEKPTNPILSLMDGEILLLPRPNCNPLVYTMVKFQTPVPHVE